MNISTNTRGFTLVGLVSVIIILGILAAVAIPRFIDLQSDAKDSAVMAIAGNFKSGVSMAHAAWIAKGASGPIEDLPLYSDAPDRSDTIDINANGWPVQHFLGPHEPTPLLNNSEDCVSLWRIMFVNREPTVSTLGYADYPVVDYQASYISPGQCDYVLREDPAYKIYYNSNNGKVTTTIP